MLTHGQTQKFLGRNIPSRWVGNADPRPDPEIFGSQHCDPSRPVGSEMLTHGPTQKVLGRNIVTQAVPLGRKC
ncbi:hypothetical protein PsorP6_004432 [Peronosclerospora sorghi]|uniref:Uncharacterized protein n=1 Tax=Peronosclerospora sorghi TaxID=230839 RepID=A0ACC0VLU7_9STRA|nr:hypothetical protein PsorP6_004432 [Peronosclerospora sorghi]